MKLTQSINLFCIVAALLSVSTDVFADEEWSCSYTGFGNSKIQVNVNYHISGNRLEEVGSSTLSYDVLENSRTAIVAADGSSIAAYLAPERGQMIAGTILIIKKDSGEFVLGNVAWRPGGSDQETTSGKCHRVTY